MACPRLGRFWRSGSRPLRRPGRSGPRPSSPRPLWSSATAVLRCSSPRHMLLWHSAVLSLFDAWFRLDPSIASALGALGALLPPSVLGRSGPRSLWSSAAAVLRRSGPRSLRSSAVSFRSGAPVLGRSSPRSLWSSAAAVLHSLTCVCFCVSAPRLSTGLLFPWRFSLGHFAIRYSPDVARAD